MVMLSRANDIKKMSRRRSSEKRSRRRRVSMNQTRACLDGARLLRGG